MLKISIEQAGLSKLVERVSGPALSKSTMPVLKHLLLETDGSTGLRVTSNNLMMSMSGTAAADVSESGAVLVPAKDFKKIAKAMPKSSRVEIEELDNAYVHVSTADGKVKYKLAGIPAEDFPEQIKDDSRGVAFSAPAKTLLDLLEGIYDGISWDETRPQLNAAAIESAGPKSVRFVATNGHLLAKQERVVDVQVPKDDLEALISRDALTTVRVLLAAAGESDVNVSTSHRSVKFDMEIDDEPTFLLCKSVDAKFPPWEKVVPKSWERTLKVRREDLVAAIGRVSIVSRLKLPTVVLTMTSEGSLLHPDGSVTIASEVSSAGEGSESVEALYDGTDKFMIGFNETYLSCALSAMHGETMTMCFNSGTDAVIVRGDDDDPYWVVMPFRL